MVVDDRRLRRATPGDEVAIHRLFCLPEVFEFLADGVAPPPGIASAWIAAASTGPGRRGHGLWVLTGGDGSTVDGVVRLAREGEGEGELELTYLLHPRLWGRGLATRMAHTVMVQAFEAGAATIRAGADAPNAASLAVMERLGMRFRREVRYPLGAGLEYEVTATDFDPGRIEPLAVE